MISVLQRTHHCGDFTDKDIDKQVTLCGWIDTRRDHGGLIFVDLWDKYGLTQVVLNPQIDQLAHEHAQSIRGNFVIGVVGTVRARPEDMVNPKLKTGKIEVYVDALSILNKSETPPISPWEPQDTSEALRLKYRFLDLRGPELQRNLKIRYDITRTARNELHRHGFMEVETPMLTKSTPEGARDYLVPSRSNPQKFYALPQSPQLWRLRQSIKLLWIRSTGNKVITRPFGGALSQHWSFHFHETMPMQLVAGSASDVVANF